MKKLNEKQKQAVEMIASKKHKIVSLVGPGGTGKTFTLQHLPKHWKIAYTAPTNKAVSVLIESGCPAEHCYTIYSFMGLKINESNGKITVDKENRCKSANYDVLVIDESSMISADMVNKIKSMVASNLNLMLIYMGDACQLPPVGEQKSTAFYDVGESITLVEQMRQSSSGHPLTPLLDDLRNAISTGDNVDFTKYSNQVTDKNLNHKVGIITSNSQKQFNKWILSSFVDDNREFNNTIVSYRNEKVDEYNKMIHNKKHPDTKYPYAIGEIVATQKPVRINAIVEFQDKFRESVYKIDEKIIIGDISESTHSFFMGKDEITVDCLVITDESNGNKLRCLPNRNEFNRWWQQQANILNNKNIKPTFSWNNLYSVRDDFADIRLCYAVTVHKSQGSTFDNVFVDVNDINLMREPQNIINQCLYTAFSRARFNAISLVR